jgi:glycyl-tRNA synthetase beta subunit
VEVPAKALAETADFVRRRLEGVLKEEYNLPHDIVQAVLAERGDNPWLALLTARDLVAAVARPDWSDILNAYARCVRIVRPIAERYTVQPNRFADPAEKALYAAYQQARTAIAPTSTLAEAVTVLREVLVAPINTFFDKVLVMDKDDAIRQNRLALLQDIRDLTRGYADFSQLQGF